MSSGVCGKTDGSPSMIVMFLSLFSVIFENRGRYVSYETSGNGFVTALTETIGFTIDVCESKLPSMKLSLISVCTLNPLTESAVFDGLILVLCGL